MPPMLMCNRITSISDDGGQFNKGQIEAEFDIKADIVDKNGFRVPVFEVKVDKKIILHDQNKDLLQQEKETVSVDGVNVTRGDIAIYLTCVAATF